MHTSGRERRARAPRSPAARTGRSTRSAVAELAGGLGTALPALGLLVWLVVVAALCPVGIGLLLAPQALRGLRDLADRERRRLGRWGEELLPGGEVPAPLRAALADPVVRRELRWLPVHAVGGLLLGLVGALLPLYAVRDTTFPLWRHLVPAGVDSSPWWWTVQDWRGAAAVALLGLGWAVLTVVAAPGMARLQRSAGRRLLAPPPGADLSLRVAELTATRAAALDAHVSELRRIERSLHDGAQNRLVGVNVLLGAARRSLTRNPAHSEQLLERA